MGKLYVAIVAAILATGGIAQADSVSLHGSATVVDAIVAPHKTEIELLSGEQLDIVGNGSQRGLADLAAGVKKKSWIALIGPMSFRSADALRLS
jgi:hypothetical protein